MILNAGSTYFTVERNITSSGRKIIVIEDISSESSFKGMTVTNTAERVIDTIVRITGNIPDDAIVVYRDSSGIWDGMKVKNGVFQSFILIGSDSKEAAINTLAQRQVSATR